MVVGDVAGLSSCPFPKANLYSLLCVSLNCVEATGVAVKVLVLVEQFLVRGGVIVEWLVCWTSNSEVGFQILARAEISLKISAALIPALMITVTVLYFWWKDLMVMEGGWPANLIC